jgi:hypothetical protein
MLLKGLYVLLKGAIRVTEGAVRVTGRNLVALLLRAGSIHMSTWLSRTIDCTTTTAPQIAWTAFLSHMAASGSAEANSAGGGAAQTHSTTAQQGHGVTCDTGGRRPRLGQQRRRRFSQAGAEDSGCRRAHARPHNARKAQHST